MSTPLSPSEQAQMLQTIDMFDVIAQSNPADHESLEILREAYSKLGRSTDVLTTSKRIAQAYVLSGKLSSAILEYESVLQFFPDDPDSRKALAEIETRAAGLGHSPSAADLDAIAKALPGAPKSPTAADSAAAPGLDDGRGAMRKLLVDGKHISASDFDLYWPSIDATQPPKQVTEPFLHVLAEKQLLPCDKSLKLLSERSRLSYLPLEKYDVDVELARSYPRETCLRWCVLPFDRMSRSVLVATANPFNERVARELQAHAAQAGQPTRFVQYVASPAELLKILRKIFR